MDIKTLRVCLSGDLPLDIDRDDNFYYFLYDNLTLYNGKIQYYDLYAIVENMPSEPAYNILYFVLSDGTVRQYINYSIRILAHIENDEQLELLRKSGSTFFVNSRRRYLDNTRRIITLPYLNGTYELSVNLANDLLLDEDTVIKFNTETNEFEIAGNIADIDTVDFIRRDFHSKDTGSINTNLTDNKIDTNVKISNDARNILQVLPDGLFVDSSDKVLKEEFEKWVENYQQKSETISKFISVLEADMNHLNSIINENSIKNKILEALNERYSEIEDALKYFNETFIDLEAFKNECRKYINQRYDTTYNSLNVIVSSNATNPWYNYSEEI